MLSKSAARLFFLVGTFATTVAFVALTVDTLRQVPEQTNEAQLSPAVIRGKELWESNNCMGCHTLFGEGAYYAPDLTQVYERRGPAFIRQMLTDPEGLYPGQRRMVTYAFTQEEQDDMIAFLEWCSHVDLNGFPPPPTVGVATAPAGAGAVAVPQVYQQICSACHAVGGVGGQVGPALDGVASRRDADYLRRWLEDPLAINPKSRMPKMPLTPEQLEEVLAYLSTLKAGEPAP